MLSDNGSNFVIAVNYSDELVLPCALVFDTPMAHQLQRGHAGLGRSQSVGGQLVRGYNLGIKNMNSLTHQAPIACCKKLLVLAFLVMAPWGSARVNAQGTGWKLWASGLPHGGTAHLAVAPDHSIYFGMRPGGTPGTQGIVRRSSNTLGASGTFVAMPVIPYASIANDIMAITTTLNSEPVVGIFHATSSQNLNDPIAFVFDNTTGQWITASVNVPALLGVFAMATAPNGDIWFGAKWSRIYHSTDAGRTYTAIDESALVAAAAPCYYPSIYGNNPSDGAIYSINVDRRGWVYAGTEGAGVVYSDDRGATWKPVDVFPCDPQNPMKHNLASPMEPVTYTGNTGAVGFTGNNNLVWNGTNLYAYTNWPSSIGFADVASHTVVPATGFLQNFINNGLQTERIVTTANGRMFLHSGTNANFDPNPPPPPGRSTYSMGIYTSTDGVHWIQFNTGISSNNDGLSEGSLAVDGNRVFTETSDGNVWYFDTDDTIFKDGFGG
jgi:hypothetical protein